MQMTNEEIIASYRKADKKFAQIRTLADLNVCKPMEIVEILKEAGEQLPGNYAKRKQEDKTAHDGTQEDTAPVPEPVGETQKLTRADFLDEARACVCGKREQDYGSPENNFETIAQLWMAYLRGAGYVLPVELEPHDVAAMMILVKVARVAGGGLRAHPDNWVDIVGYAACGGELQTNPTICRGE